MGEGGRRKLLGHAFKKNQVLRFNFFFLSKTGHPTGWGGGSDEKKVTSHALKKNQVLRFFFFF